MDTKRIEILHIANSDTIIMSIANHFIFYLFPSFQTFLYKNLWRKGKSFLCQYIQFVLVITEATTKSPKCIGRTDDNGITKIGCSYPRLYYVLTCLTLDCLNIDLIQFLYKEFTILGIHNCLYRGTEHFHIVFIEHTAFKELHSTVQCGLSAKR